MIVIQNLNVRAGSFCAQNINLEIPAGQYGVLMGRTGCGKTTLLEAICGLRSVDSGSIRLMDRDVTHLKPALRGIGYVPQDRALFQTMTVREHLAFALTIQNWDRSALEQRVAELASLLGISKLLDRKPYGLSGGEAQRVALGRALASRPGLLLLDEPLSALDDETRQEMYALLKSLKERAQVTTLHVTHSHEEAELLADRIFVFENGTIQQRKKAKPLNEQSDGRPVQTETETNVLPERL